MVSILLLFSLFPFGEAASPPSISVYHPCQGLEPKQGIWLNCKYNGKPVNCTSEKIPSGTEANFSCDKYYRNQNYRKENKNKAIKCMNGRWKQKFLYNDLNCAIECGEAKILTPTSEKNENEIDEKFWPWHATIYKGDSKNNTWNFACTGSLINPLGKGFLILTAAHCLLKSRYGYATEAQSNFKVILGTKRSEFEKNLEYSNITQVLNVSHVSIYEDFESKRFKGYYNDLGILVLKEEVKLSDYVLPVCFPRELELRNDVGMIGIMGGYGYTKKAILYPTLRFAELPIVPSEECGDVMEVDSSQFCAGYPTSDLQSACYGDTGSGFLVESNSKYFVQGVSSIGSTFFNGMVCFGFTIFTKLNAQHLFWIRETQEDIYNEIAENLVDSGRRNNASTTPPPTTTTPIPTTTRSYLIDKTTTGNSSIENNNQNANCERFNGLDFPIICKTSGEGILRQHPLDCNKYYSCDFINGNFTMNFQRCLKTEVFINEKQACEEDGECRHIGFRSTDPYNCFDQDVFDPLEYYTQSLDFVVLPQVNNSFSNWIRVRSKPIVNIRELSPEFPMFCTMIRNSELKRQFSPDCQKYYRCEYYNGNFDIRMYNCGKGRVFVEEFQRCEDRSKVECKSVKCFNENNFKYLSSLMKLKPKKASNPFPVALLRDMQPCPYPGLFPIYGSCDKFIECKFDSNGLTAMNRTCDKGAVYFPNEMKCDVGFDCPQKYVQVE